MPNESSPTAAQPRALERELFAIDVRSLALFRIALGSLWLVDLYGRAKTLREHYTGEGVFPRELAAAMRPDLVPIRLFLLSDRFEVQSALFALFALVALLFVLGWRTRLMSGIAFVLLASLVRRNPYVCHTGDVLLKALSFWAVFLPLGAHFSVDRLRGRLPVPRAPALLSLATAGSLLQIAIFYVMAGYLKSRYDVWQRGEAVWVFTHVIEYTRPFGAWIGRSPAACTFLTYATLVLEGLGPFLFFVPFWTARVRTLLVLVFAGFHLTLQATIHIGIFQLLCVAMLSLFLPSAAWDALARRGSARGRALWARIREAFVRRWGRAPAESPARAGHAWLEVVLLVPALSVILVSNVNSAVADPYDRSERGPIPLPKLVDDYGRAMSLVQSWNMFTDIEHLFFGWFLVLGQTEDGSLVDVLQRKPFTTIELPEHYARFFPNHNSRRYWRELTITDEGKPREYLQKTMCDYLARQWRAAGGSPLTQLAIFHVGRVPSQRQERDTVRPVCTQWEAEHEPLRTATPETQALWKGRRARWSEFLASLPKTVATAR